MKTAIIYATTHGTTEKVAAQIARGLGADSTTLFNLKTTNHIDLAAFDQIIIGGSVHAGNIQQRVKNYCKQNMLDLLQKRLGIFLCGMNEPEYQTQFEKAFPELLRKHAISTKVVGGEFLFEQMNFFQRLIVKKISGISESQSRIKQEKIDELVREMKNDE